MNGGHRQWNGTTFPLLPATSRWSDSSLETRWCEAAELLHYASPHWSCIRYHAFGVLDLTAKPLKYNEQPNLHLLGVGAHDPPIYSAFATAIFQQGNA
ncbi:hypothetical protein TNCV_2058951 [Trichonephila clavipes]|nr:hypothetical protein TNCV_2058951 [Trichonephila clavipes]